MSLVIIGPTTSIQTELGLVITIKNNSEVMYINKSI